MGLALLPWERLPEWLLGPLVAAVGVFLVLHAEPYSWRQYEAVAFVIFGMALLVHGVKKLLAKPAADVASDKK